jgi:hypothetical protein
MSIFNFLCKLFETKRDTMYINGRHIELPPGAHNVSIINGKVMIDGKEFDGDCDGKDAIVKIEQGEVVSVKSDRSVTCGNVKGDVSAQGSVNCDDVGGCVTAGGSVNCDGVGGSVSAGGSVNCDDINGTVSAGGSIRCNNHR